MLISIKRPVTVALLLAATAVILGVTMWLQGSSYTKMDPVPFESVKHLWHRLTHHGVSTTIVAVIVIPIIGNILLFLPWGFFLFIALYTVDRPTLQTYVLTILLGFSFSAGIEAYQYFLPSRVADVNDVIWNSVGATLGAILGHARLRLRVEFE